MNEHDMFFDELKTDVDTAHDLIDGGSRPPSDLWKTVRAQALPTTTQKEKPMIATQVPSGLSAPNITPAVTSQGRLRHSLSFAFSVALVFMVALGGWFATMQLNQPNGSDGQFGLFGQTDQSATCNAEPMTVDEVMAIVENPYRYMDEEDYPNPIGSTSHQTPWEYDYLEVQPRLPDSLNAGLDTEPTQSAFDQASVVIDEYLGCMQVDGSVAMMLRFSDPISIQNHVRTEFPFYRTEEQVREYVTNWIASEEIYHPLSHERQGETYTYRPAQEKSMAGTQIHDFGLGFDQVIYVGAEIYDENGEFVGNFHPILYRTYNVDQEYLDHGVVFTLLHSRYTGEWYIVTDGWMNLDSLL